MFQFGENGYNEYRASHGSGAYNVGPLVSAACVIIGITLTSGFAYFIGAFLYYSWGR